MPLSFTSGTGNTAGLEWTINVPGATISAQASPAATSAGKTLYCNGNTCLLIGLDTNTLPNGVIANVSVALPATATGTLPVQLTNAVESLADGTAGVITMVNGSIAVGNSPVLPVPSNLQCTPSNVGSGQATNCSVTLSAPAPVSGATISLSSSSGTVSVPATVAIPANSSSVSFAAAAGTVTAVQNATVTASLNGSSQTATLSLSPGVSLSSLQCANAVVASNGSTTCTVALTAAAASDTSVSLSAQNSFLTVPARISIPAGAASTSFAINAGSASTAESAIVTATLANGVSTAFAVTVMPSSVLLIQGSQSELSGVSNGSTITPTMGPAGFTGTVVANGNGSVNFSPVEAANGVYFLNCCNNDNNAYYKFTGAGVGNVFNANQGQISFFLKSRYSFAQRQANAAAPRYAFDVRDGNNNHLFGFLTGIGTSSDGAYLVFNYLAAGSGSYYCVPIGTEDTLLGNGVTLQVTISWNGSEVDLYLNNNLVKSTPYTAPTANWNSDSNFDLGAYEYLTFGGYNVSDDIVSDFNVKTTASATTPPSAPSPTAPVISAVSVTSMTSSGATITWTTDKGSSSQVAYGPTTAQEITSTLDPTLVTSHSVALTGLQPATTYHFHAQSVDANGNVATSLDSTFTTSAGSAGSGVLLQLHADASELSGTSNGSIVTPATAPPGFSGTVVVNGSGSVNFAPAQSGNGVYFLNCCNNTDDAYYKFTGASVGDIFNVDQGKISFYLKSRYSFAQRAASAAAPRFAFDVRDGSNSDLFGFLTQVGTSSTGAYLAFSYRAAGSGSYYFVPVGTEDQLFGNGVTLKVTITWDGSTTNLYLNDALVKSSPYTRPTPNWTAASLFDLGAYEYQTLGGFNVSDDIIDEFTVSPLPQE